MKNVFLIGFAVILFTACMEPNIKIMQTNFAGTATNDDRVQKNPTKPAMENAKIAWNKTKTCCKLLWYLIY